MSRFRSSKKPYMKRSEPNTTLKSRRIIQRLGAYRDFYWKLDIDPTKTRPSGEALLGRVLHGHDLPCISMVVDAYNLASMKTIIQISGFNKDRLNSPLQICFAENDETFTGIGISSGWFWQNTVSNNNISYKKYGVYIEVADSNVISENIVMNSKEEGIHIYLSLIHI